MGKFWQISVRRYFIAGSMDISLRTKGETWYIMNSRELTKKEKAKIRRLVSTQCACFDEKEGCFPLDGGCYMCTIGFTDSPLCGYFQKCVLPLEPEVQAIWSGNGIRICKHCGKPFPRNGKRIYCSKQCADSERRKQIRTSVRKHRNKEGKM